MCVYKHKHYYCSNCISKSNCIKSTCETDRKDMQLKCREEYCAYVDSGSDGFGHAAHIIQMT